MEDKNKKKGISGKLTMTEARSFVGRHKRLMTAAAAFVIIAAITLPVANYALERYEDKLEARYETKLNAQAAGQTDTLQTTATDAQTSPTRLTDDNNDPEDAQEQRALAELAKKAGCTESEALSVLKKHLNLKDSADIVSDGLEEENGALFYEFKYLDTKRVVHSYMVNASTRAVVEEMDDDHDDRNDIDDDRYEYDD